MRSLPAIALSLVVLSACASAPAGGSGGAAGAASGTHVSGRASGPADSTTPSAPTTYEDSIAAWREAREKRLLSDTGWLTVAGLFWLEPGENSFGADSSNAIVLPPGSAPARAGGFIVEGAPDGPGSADSSSGSDAATAGRAPRVRVRAAGNAGIRLGDSLVTERALLADADEGGPDVLSVGRLQLFVLERNHRFAIRMRDPESPIRRAFRGIDYYPVDPAARVEARLVRFEGGPHAIEVPNFAGYSDSMVSPGVVTFVLGGNRLQLQPALEDPADSSFFFIFADETTERETYGGGRFLYADLRPDGTLTLDFNKAYNPPCAFTPYTTCPMPPEGNRLPIALRAGEKKHEGLGAH